MTPITDNIVLTGNESSLLIALIIGISFGFFLEKGGLGNSRKLAGQFYFTDLTVFKVMFTAIITAMLGLFILSWTGIIDLHLINLTPTYIIPYIIAGLLFGAGFIIGGLCPGTSCVSAATGRLDGFVLLIGVFSGIFLFGETFRFFGGFLYATPMYQISVPAFFDISYGLIVFVITVIALAGFAGAEKVEKKYSKKAGYEQLSSVTLGKIPIYSLVTLTLLLALITLIAGDPYREPYNTDAKLSKYLSRKGVKMISSADLAQIIIKRDTAYVLVDLRSPEQFADYHIPSALNPITDDDIRDLKEYGMKIIFYMQDNSIDDELLNELLTVFDSDFLYLKDGITGWQKEVLFPDLNIPNGYSPDQIDSIATRSYFFGGTPRLNKDISKTGEKYIREGC